MFINAHCREKAKVGVDFINEVNGVKPNECRRIMIKNSKQSVLLCDSSKFGFATTFKLCSLKDIDVLITDKEFTDQVDINKNQLPETIICE